MVCSEEKVKEGPEYSPGRICALWKIGAIVASLSHLSPSSKNRK